MPSVDADLRSGRRLDTERRSESIIYVAYSFPYDSLFKILMLNFLFAINLSFDLLEYYCKYLQSMRTLFSNSLSVPLALLLQDRVPVWS